MYIEHFCSERLHGYHNKKALRKHDCCNAEGSLTTGPRPKQKQIKSSQIGKDPTRAFHKQSMTGGKDKVGTQLQNEIVKLKGAGCRHNLEHYL